MLLVFLPAHSILAQTEGDYLYNVTMLRAAPGQFNDLVAALMEEAQELADAEGDSRPFLLRHSQGDQWDFMVIYPMGSRASYHSASRSDTRASLWNTPRGTALRRRLATHTSYREEWFARSIPPGELSGRFEGMGLFHVEMFAGLPGRRAELLEQRRMENRYYAHLNRQLNVLFIREAGSNWDAMTIGFHESLVAFAEAGTRFSAAEQDAAARVAGFTGVEDVGPYLRSLLSYHHDTIAVPLR
jgi:hypothetical protein